MKEILACVHAALELQLKTTLTFCGHNSIGTNYYCVGGYLPICQSAKLKSPALQYTCCYSGK